MTTLVETRSNSNALLLWTGWVLTGLIAALLAFSSIIKLVGVPEVRQTMAGLGWPADLDFAVGVIELICVSLYLIPRTAGLGAILETALLGGTVAVKLRVGDPMATHVLFGVYMGAIVWAGLYLRDPRLRALMPWRKS